MAEMTLKVNPIRQPRHFTQMCLKSRPNYMYEFDSWLHTLPGYYLDE